MRNLVAILLVSITSITGIYAQQWSIVGSAGITGAVANYTDMEVNNNGVPYIAYADNANSDKLSVKYWTGTSWTSLGTAISSGSVHYVSMSIDPDNNDIYVAYKDNAQSGKLSVKKHNGSSWSTLGNGITPSSVDYVSATVSPVSGKLYVAYKDNNKSGKASVCYYHNGNWYNLGSQGFTSGSVSYVSMIVTTNGYGYIAYKDHNNKPAMVEWTSGGWSSVANPSSSSCNNVTISADNNNVPYVAYIDGGNSNKLTVRKYSNNSWSTVGSAGFTPGSVGSPEILVDTNNNTPYVVYKDNNNSQKASVMKYGGSSWSNVGSAGFTANTVDYISIAVDDNDVLYVGFKDNAVSQKATVMKYDPSMPTFTGITWDGSSSTDWNTAANWSTNNVPSTGDNILIPSGLSRYPNITYSTTLKCKDLTIQNGASLTINHSSAKLRIYGNVSNSGSFDVPKGRIEIRGSSAQTFTTSSDVETDEFRMQNSGGCTLSGNGDIVVTDKFQPKGGTLTTNGNLVLKSTSSGTARIDKGSTSGGYISGDVTIQQYIAGGQRAYRFFSHPFTSSIKLSQLTDDIDITGQGGTANGFTAVQVNAPSAFWFDVTTADTSTAGNNPGWKDFTSANTNSWARYQMARIMVRGSKGQGLTQGSYTPAAVTLDMKGSINQGNQTVTITKGNNSDFIICGNPFPSQVNLKDVSRNNVSSNFCVWNPRQGTFGGYTAHQFSSNYYLPAYGAFVTEVTSGNSASFTFEEKDKKGNTPAGLFKGTADPIEIEDDKYTVTLDIEGSGIFWDRLIIEFDSSSVATKNDRDMLKFYNPDLDFYSITDDSVRASVDVRPYAYGEVIPLGIVAYEDRQFSIKTSGFRIPTGSQLYLYDKYLNKSEHITQNFIYNFSIDTSKAGTMGDRFSINMGYPNSIVDINRENDAILSIAPNPAHSITRISISGLNESAVLRVSDITGKTVLQRLANNTGVIELQVQQLKAGVYFVELNNEYIKTVKKLVVQ